MKKVFSISSKSTSLDSCVHFKDLLKQKILCDKMKLHDRSVKIKFVNTPQSAYIFCYKPYVSLSNSEEYIFLYNLTEKKVIFSYKFCDFIQNHKMFNDPISKTIFDVFSVVIAEMIDPYSFIMCVKARKRSEYGDMEIFFFHFEYDSSISNFVVKKKIDINSSNFIKQIGLSKYDVCLDKIEAVEVNKYDGNSTVILNVKIKQFMYNTVLVVIDIKNNYKIVNKLLLNSEIGYFLRYFLNPNATSYVVNFINKSTVLISHTDSNASYTWNFVNSQKHHKFNNMTNFFQGMVKEFETNTNYKHIFDSRAEVISSKEVFFSFQFSTNPKYYYYYDQSLFKKQFCWGFFNFRNSNSTYFVKSGRNVQKVAVNYAKSLFTSPNDIVFLSPSHILFVREQYIRWRYLTTYTHEFKCKETNELFVGELFDVQKMQIHKLFLPIFSQNTYSTSKIKTFSVFPIGNNKIALFIKDELHVYSYSSLIHGQGTFLRRNIHKKLHKNLFTDISIHLYK